jgi:glucokinase
MNGKVLALDIGATKAAVGLFDHQLHLSKRVEIPTGKNENIWDSLSVVISELIKDSVIEGVGIGSAGPLHLEKGAISPVNIPTWREFPIVQKLAELLNLEQERINLHGDAIALANAEHKVGAGQGLQNMLGMVVSTGIGGGLVLDGKLQLGITGNSGYFGHHSISFESDPCVCGRIGCVEMFASGPMMVEYAKSIGADSSITTFEDLYAEAESGNSAAIKSIKRGADALAQAIVNVLCILDIKSVVVGGGVIQSGDLYWSELEARVQHHAQFAKFIGKVDLRKSTLSKDAGLIGAALAYLDM